MKAKKLTRKDQQLLDYENMKLDLFREVGRMEELRRIRNRNYFPKELQKLREIFEAIEEIQNYQLQIFQQINRKEAYNPIPIYARAVAVFLILILVSLPLHFSKLAFIPTQALEVIDTSPPPTIADIPPLADSNLIAGTAVEQQTILVEEAPVPNTNSVLSKVLTSNYRNKSNPELKISENISQLEITNRSDTLLYFELLDQDKRKIFGEVFKDSIVINKKEYKTPRGYYFRVKKANQLIHVGEL